MPVELAVGIAIACVIFAAWGATQIIRGILASRLPGELKHTFDILRKRQ